MTLIIEKIFELISAWISHLLPWSILGDDQCGLIRRLGKYRRTMKHGLNWKWPIIETAMTEIAALESTVLREQSLTTSDDVQVTVRGVITYRVVDPRKYILDCATAQSVVNDVGCCVIAEMIPGLAAREVLHGEAFTVDFLKRVRVRAKKWGIKVDSCGVIDRVEAKAYRIITSAGRDGINDVVPQ